MTETVKQAGKAVNRARAYTLISLAVLLGGGSLLAFGGFLVLGPWTFLDLELGPGAGLAWDAMLCLLFFGVHSGLLRRSVKARLVPLVRRELQPALYALVSGVFLLALVLLWQETGMLHQVRGAWRMVLRAAFILALAGFFWTGRSLNSLDPLGHREALGFLKAKKSRSGPLVIRGPYQWVRHPFYLFSLIMIWAGPDISLDRLLFNFLFSAWIAAGALWEERDLVRRFGEDYRRYQALVPMLIPTRPRPLDRESR